MNSPDYAPTWHWKKFPVDVVGFFLGCLLLVNLPQLPSWFGAADYWWFRGVLVAALLVSGFLGRERLWFRFGLALVLGFVWAGWSAQDRLEARLPTSLEGQSIVVEGVVEGLPRRGGGRFPFRVSRILSVDNDAINLSGRVRLGWQTSPDQTALQLGQKWRLTVRLKRPRGLSNPGDFDYERWLFESAYIASGYVRTKEARPLLLEQGKGIAAWRQDLANGVERAIGERPFSGVMIALLMGDRFGLDTAQWEVFRQTGTGHLVAISGLHVGLVAGLGFFLLRRLAGPWSFHVGSPRVAALGAFCLAALYAALAGFTLPTQRALIMLGVGLGSVAAGREVSPLRALALALLLVLLRDPLAVLSGGFWLSFAAVGLILLSVLGHVGADDRLAPGAIWRRWGRVHWLVSLGLAPVALVWFGQTSVISPLANLLAVPWVSFLVVPASLLGGVLVQVWPWAGALLLVAGEWLFSLLWVVLQWGGELDLAIWHPPGLDGLALFSLVLVVLLAAAPRGWPGRWLALPLLVTVLVGEQHAVPEPGDFRVSVLDVGQGLSVVVQTTGHVLVYDTGPRYRSGFDTGAAVVLPFLRNRGIERVDVLLVSHGDMDHRGGYEAVRDGIEVGQVLSGEPDRVPGAGPCRAGGQWQWDGVTFRVLGPHGLVSADAESRLTGNNASCVLRISNAGGAVLLTADLEKSGEALLLDHYGDELQARVMQIPHHGSRTSSSVAFIEAVEPEIGLVTSGYRNHFGLPKPDILQRYAAAEVAVFDTRDHGMLELVMGQDGQLTGPLVWRQRQQRLWSVD